MQERPYDRQHPVTPAYRANYDRVFPKFSRREGITPSLKPEPPAAAQVVSTATPVKVDGSGFPFFRSCKASDCRSCPLTDCPSHPPNLLPIGSRYGIDFVTITERCAA